MKKILIFVGLVVVFIFLVIYFTSHYFVIGSTTEVEKYTAKAIEKHDISVCDRVVSLTMGGTTEDLRGICYQGYVAKYPQENNVCSNLLVDSESPETVAGNWTHGIYKLCVISAAVKSLDTEICLMSKDPDWTCVAYIANIKNNVDICDILPNSEEKQKCVTYFSNYSYLRQPPNSNSK